MTGSIFRVSSRSTENIAAIAMDIRAHLGVEGEPHFNVIGLLEDLLYQEWDQVRFEVCDSEEMDGAEGHTCPAGTFIALREDVYRGACNGDGRARFTVAHELGHLVLHAKQPLRRAAAGELKPFQSSEWQADMFAAQLLMPAQFFSWVDNEQSVMRRHGVTHSAARYRLNHLRKKGII